MKYTKYKTYEDIDDVYLDDFVSQRFERFSFDIINEMNIYEDKKLEVTPDIATVLQVAGHLEMTAPDDLNDRVYTDKNYQMYVGNIGDKEIHVYID